MDINLDRPVSLGKLNRELNDKLGRPVTLRRAGNTLTLLDDETGEPLPNKSVDPRVVLSVITEHVFDDPTAQPTMAERMVKALESATTIAQLRDALLNVYKAEVLKDQEIRSRLRRRLR